MKVLLIIFLNMLISAFALPNFQSQLENSEKNTSMLQDKIDNLQEAIGLQTSAITDMEVRLKMLDSSIQSREMLIKERVKATIMYTIPDRIDFLKAVDSYDDFIRGDAIISHMLRNDLFLYKSYSKELAEINELRIVLDSERAKMVLNQDNLRLSLEKLKETVRQKKKILEEARTDRKKYQAYIDHINRGASQISSFVKKEAVHVFQKANPIIKNYFSPARDGVIVQRYGKNRGITVQLPYGTEIYSVSNGVVRFSGWVLGYGKVVIVEHVGGVFSIYGHLAKTMFSVGEKVKKGTAIALSGDTGSVDNAALYFELRYRDKNMDPTQLFM